MTRGMPDDYDAPDLEPVPTLRELVPMRLATPTDGSKTPRYRVEPRGWMLIHGAMARNAARQRAWNEGGRAAARELVTA